MLKFAIACVQAALLTLKQLIPAAGNEPSTDMHNTSCILGLVLLKPDVQQLCCE